MQMICSKKNEFSQRFENKITKSVLDSSSQSKSLQRKADMANNAAQRAEAPRPNNTGMPDNLKAGIESLSGFSMDNVRVHYNSSKPATVQALAYTQGTDIHVAPGQEKCLPHEAWHVAQQMAGRVSPTTNINGMPVNDNAALEHEADVMGEKAVAQKMVNKSVVQCRMGKSVIQRNFYWAMSPKDGAAGSWKMPQKAGVYYKTNHSDKEHPDKLYQSLDSARNGVIKCLIEYAKNNKLRLERLSSNRRRKGALADSGAGGVETLCRCRNQNGEVCGFVGYSYEANDENCELKKVSISEQEKKRSKEKVFEEQNVESETKVKHFHAIYHKNDDGGKYDHIDSSAAHYLILPPKFR